MGYLSRIRYVWYGLIILSASIALSYQPNWELAVSSHFFDPIVRFKSSPLTLFIYNYLTIVPLSVFLLLLFLSLTAKGNRKTSALKALLAMVFIALAVELLKSTIDRTRPYDLKMFGGIYDYLAIGWQSYDKDSISFRSFPSGHAASGFCLLSLTFLFSRGLKYNLTVITALILGAIFSWARIYQGAHYLSDVLGSLAVILIIVGLIDFLILKFNPKLRILYNAIHSNNIFRRAIKASGWALFAAFVLISPYYYYTINYISIAETKKLEPIIDETKIIVSHHPDIEIQLKPHLARPEIRFTANGNVATNFEIKPEFDIQKNGNKLHISLNYNTKGVARHLNLNATIKIPPHLISEVSIINSKF